MTAARSTTQAPDPADRAAPAAIDTDEGPRGVIEAAAMLDRIAFYCAHVCDHAAACIEADCSAWRLERTAADYLASHWATAEG